MMRGYVNRYGEFFDCSKERTPFQHDRFCDKLGITEDELMNDLGWVKLTSALPHDYIYMCAKSISDAQINWLVSHGYEIHKEDKWN